MRKLAENENMNQRMDVVLRKYPSWANAFPPGMCPLAMYRSFLQIAINQSCGKCVPCRDGLVEADRLMRKIIEGGGTGDILEQLRDLCEMIHKTADCAVGSMAAGLVLDRMREFTDEYESHIRARRCVAPAQQTVPCMTLCPNTHIANNTC